MMILGDVPDGVMWVMCVCVSTLPSLLCAESSEGDDSAGDLGPLDPQAITLHNTVPPCRLWWWSSYTQKVDSWVGMQHQWHQLM